jgi:hypothetical protein
VVSLIRHSNKIAISSNATLVDGKIIHVYFTQRKYLVLVTPDLLPRLAVHDQYT